MNRFLRSMWLAIGLVGGSVVAAMAQPATLVEVRRIWDAAEHNAFTDLIRFNDRWFCVFREGAGHVSPDGALRVIHSQDGQHWESAALITSEHADLRDAKITATPDGRLMLAGAESLHDKSSHSHQSVAWFSDDGFQWSEAVEIGDRDDWLWRVTWHDAVAYSVGYAVGKQNRRVRLYHSPDGRRFETLVSTLFDEGYPNETSIVFDDQTAYCLLRRDGSSNTGLIGTASPPYTDWQWRDLGVRIGGPHMLRLSDGRWLAAVRLYDRPVRTSLCWLDPEAGQLTEFLALPSGGDTSYAGLVEHDGLLWVSYYSSHEGKTSIYLAKVQLPEPVVEIGQRLELLVDDFLVSSSSGVEPFLVRPEPREVVLVTDAAWEGNTSAYYAIFADGDRFRMYYRGSHFDEQTGAEGHPEVTCYAESIDGVTWTKPSVGRYPFAGSSDNNIVWAGENTHNFTVLKDTRPDAPAEARYKALAGSAIRWGGQGLIAYRSADGLQWAPVQSQPVITDGDFDSQNLAFWYPVQNRYLAYHRKFRDGNREIMVSWSEDFVNWSEPEYLQYGEAPPAQLYTNAVQPYPRAPHILVGFPTRFDERTQQVEPVLMTSRDGRHFRRWAEPLIPVDAPQDRDGNRSNYMAWGLLELPGRPDELSVYATEAYYSGPDSRLRRFTFETDRLVGMRAVGDSGELVTRPLRFEGDQLRVNYRARPGGRLRVSLLAEDGQALEGFALESCQPLSGDALAARVEWSTGESLSKLAGQTVRLRFELHECDFFAFQFQ